MDDIGNTVSGGLSAGQRRAIVASIVGNLLEWYDFAAFGFLAAIFAVNFFPQNDPFVSLIAAFGIFAASFVMRPLGGILFGHIGDRYGRRSALYLSSGMMTVSTVSIGLLPTYATAGAVAPVLLVAMRLLQGLSVGGEYTTASVMLAERAAPGRRGLITALVPMGCNAGTLLGSLVTAIIAMVLSHADLVAWGWRVPFLGGVLLGLFVIIMRRSLDNDPPRSPAGEGLPVVHALRNEGRNILLAWAACLLIGVFFYVMFIYLVTFMHQVDGFTDRQAFAVNTLNIFVLLVACVAAGWITDLVGRRRVQIVTLVLLILLVVPLFGYVSSPVLWQALAAQLVLTVIFSGYAGSMPVTLAELFGGKARCSAVSLSWNLSVGLVGGLSPMVAVWLLHEYRTPLSLAYLMVGTGLVSLAAVLLMEERSHVRL